MRASRLSGGRPARPGRWAMARLTPVVVLLAGAAACTSAPPAGPAPPARAPQMRHLAAPIVLEAVTSRRRSSPPPPPSTARGRCPAGFAALSGPDADPALCYHQLGRAITITYAAISLIPPYASPPMPYALVLILRADDRAPLEAITARAAGHQLAIIVAGQAWSISEVIDGPLSQGSFEILVSTRQQADELLRILGQPGCRPPACQTVPTASVRS